MTSTRKKKKNPRPVPSSRKKGEKKKEDYKGSILTELAGTVPEGKGAIPEIRGDGRKKTLCLPDLNPRRRDAAEEDDPHLDGKSTFVHVRSGPHQNVRKERSERKADRSDRFQT